MLEYVITKRHAKNSKAPGQDDPVVLRSGFNDTSHTSQECAVLLPPSTKALIISSDLMRGDLTGRALSQEFRRYKIDSAETIEPSLDAGKPSDYCNVLNILFDLPTYCMRNEIPMPETLVLITHAHNIIAHLIERMVDHNFQTYTEQEEAFLDDLINAAMDGRLDVFQKNMDSGAFEKFRKALTDPSRGMKPEYSEIRVFKMHAPSEVPFTVNCGEHLATIAPPVVQ